MAESISFLPAPSPVQLYKAGYFSALDYHFATTVGRLAGETNPLALLAAALVSRETALGHICVDLNHVAGNPVIDETGEVMPECGWPQKTAWVKALGESPLVAQSQPAAPLVMDRAERLYLARYWEYQQRLVGRLRARAANCMKTVNESLLADRLESLFPCGTPAGETDLQRMAAEKSVRQHLTVVTGGPGTGKTTTVLRMLLLIIAQALDAGDPAPKILLAAPTGKAAARLTEAIREAKVRDGNITTAFAPIVGLIPDAAMTLHRLLGFSGKGGTRFRHHAGFPLPADVLVVDESSMVDLSFMTRLVEAVPDDARLILLGDKDQLASVEAGAILGDICKGAGSGRQSINTAGAPAGFEPDTGIGRCIIELTRSFRFGSDSGIGRLARAINAGDPEAVLACLGDLALPEVSLKEVRDANEIWPLLAPMVQKHYMPVLHEKEPLARLVRFQSFRVLCGHRKGPAGVEAVNTMIRQMMRQSDAVRPAPYADGVPIMVTQNDYQLGLFNGDIGVMGPSPSEPGSLAAFFEGSDQNVKFFSPSRLPYHETVYAMSVHKSQGTEFDHIFLILPQWRSRVITRELLYTAVTRARKSVVIAASASLIREAVLSPVQRASGIADQLWE